MGCVGGTRARADRGTNARKKRKGEREGVGARGGARGGGAVGRWGVGVWSCRCVSRGGFLLETASSSRDRGGGNRRGGNRRALDGRVRRWMDG